MYLAKSSSYEHWRDHFLKVPPREADSISPLNQSLWYHKLHDCTRKLVKTEISWRVIVISPVGSGRCRPFGCYLSTKIISRCQSSCTKGQCAAPKNSVYYRNRSSHTTSRIGSPWCCLSLIYQQRECNTIFSYMFILNNSMFRNCYKKTFKTNKDYLR